MPRLSAAEKEFVKIQESTGSQDDLLSVLEGRAKLAESITRQKIAKLFIWWYFVLLLLIFVGVPVFNLVAQVITNSGDYRLELVDTIQSYSAIVGPLVGFVIAYYFKTRND